MAGKPSLRERYQVQCLPPEQNPFGVKAYDLRRAAADLTLWTASRELAEDYLRRLGEDGEDLRSVFPEKPIRLQCSLRYPIRQENPLPEGLLSRPLVFEDLWFIYRFDGALVFYLWPDRKVVFRAPFSWRGEGLRIEGFHMDSAYLRWSLPGSGRPKPDPFASEALYAVRLLDAVIKMYLFSRPVPHPIPPNLGPVDLSGYSVIALSSARPKEWWLRFEEIIQYSLDLFGRRGILATYDETLNLPWLDVDAGSFLGVCSTQTESAGGAP